MALLEDSGSIIGLIISGLGAIILFFSIINSLEQGNLEAIIQWLFTHITIITISIEFPFGITIIIILTAGGISISVKSR